MSIVGIFSRAQPSIDGHVFDAVLEESTELTTEVTEFPVETGAVGNDHVVLRPLKITMYVGISDNPFRSALFRTGQFSTLAGIGSGAIAGQTIQRLGDLAALAGLGASVINADFAAGQLATRSQSVLEEIRRIQRAGKMVDVVTSKRSYPGCVIASTFTETTKENEQGLEMTVELQQMLIINSRQEREELPAIDDTAELQGQKKFNLGEVELES